MLVSRRVISHLRDDHARDAVYEAELLAHLEALEEGVHVAEVAARDDHPVGHLPVELLQDLNRRRLKHDSNTNSHKSSTNSYISSTN